ncbi:CPBP family intramembrane glutamic endopeptidase [Pseudoclavibacter sp. CFCC 11306]|uniref:CPBP family intramembrane glutamic endopeptidase n=1 Tax=Pseudoclavibacter sp. CFCC 11306 TaxID=1564493 RepID=UPI0013018BDA|nr:type II CAAX endopeptidase family protein [Pseudoclavibacter sp. CFCC 11306]KAB1658424.1 CPBP family intramembrane metalloprotease [Pseudoclavibacter sp. CFCC 11306]
MTVPRSQREQPQPLGWQHQPLGWHWEWVRPEPLQFHRLQLSLPNYRWWRPLLTLLLAVVYYLVLSVLLFVVYGIAMFANSRSGLAGLEGLDTSRVTDPMTLSLLLVSVILMAPAVLLACLSTGLRPWRHMLSVTSRIRWRWMLWCVMPAVVTFVGTQLLVSVLTIIASLTTGGISDHEASELSSTQGWVGWPTYVVLLGMIIVLVPLQAATEEIVFRGLILQTVGGWVRRPWLAAIPSVLLFTAGHGYGFWGQLSIVVFAVTTVWLTIRTGGLEASIALHVVNNVLLFVVQATGITGDDTLEGSADTPIVLFQEVILCGSFLCWVLIAARRRRIDNTFHPAPHPVPVWHGVQPMFAVQPGFAAQPTDDTVSIRTLQPSTDGDDEQHPPMQRTQK